MNYRLISLFHSLLDDLITGCRYKNAHKRADDIEQISVLICFQIIKAHSNVKQNHSLLP